MTSAPYMRLYPADYLGDTQHLTTEQHGAYLLLLMTMWRGGGRLPDDPIKLSRIARVHPRRWHLFADVMAFFVPCGDGFITQKRLEREHEKALSISQKRSVNGAAGGRAKSLKTRGPALANATAMLGDARALPDIIVQIPEEEKEKEKEKRAHERASFDDFWKAYPHKVGKPAALRGWARAMAAAGDLDAILAGLRRYIRDKPPDRPWLNPATFLNQQRWADRPAPLDGSSPTIDRPQQVSVPRPVRSHPNGNGSDDDGFRLGEVLRGGSGSHSAH